MSNLYRRNSTWWARFKIAGVEYRRSLRTAVRAEAERRLKAVRKEIEDEVVFGIGPPMAWQTAVLAWNQQATSDLSPMTVKRYLTSLKQCSPQLHGVDLRRIDVPKLREIVRVRRQSGRDDRDHPPRSDRHIERDRLCDRRRLDRHKRDPDRAP